MKYQMHIGFVGVLLAMLLASCGGGGNDSGEDSGASRNQDPDGIWIGSFSPSTGTFTTVVMVVHSGRVMAHAFERGFAYDGDVRVTGGSWESDVTAFDVASTEKFGVASLQGEFLERERISGSYSFSTGEEGSVDLYYQPESDYPASHSEMSGTWSASFSGIIISITFNMDGSISGSSTDGCNMVGSYSIPDASRNLYEINIAQLCSGFNNAYSGFGYIYEREDGISALPLFLRDGNYFSFVPLFKQ